MIGRDEPHDSSNATPSNQRLGSSWDPKMLAQFYDYPMGPKLRAQLGITPHDYLGDHDPNYSEERAAIFAAWLAHWFVANPIDDDELLADLIDELVTMDLPDTALALATANAERISEVDFRSQLSLGIAAMMTGALREAEERFRKAQALLPEEPAPYINIAQILYHEQRLDEALTWCLAGIEAERNNLKLWDMLGVIYQAQHGEVFPEKILQLAESKSSWAGLALAADLTPTGDRFYKLSLLEKIYFAGERDYQFLVELTAAMGVAGEYARIPPLVWEVEQMATKGLPWQLHVHCAQAHLALEKGRESLVQLSKARKDIALPDEALEGLALLEKEAQELITNQTPLS